MEMTTVGISQMREIVKKCIEDATRTLNNSGGSKCWQVGKHLHPFHKQNLHRAVLSSGSFSSSFKTSSLQTGERCHIKKAPRHDTHLLSHCGAQQQPGYTSQVSLLPAVPAQPAGRSACWGNSMSKWLAVGTPADCRYSCRCALRWNGKRGALGRG